MTMRADGILLSSRYSRLLFVTLLFTFGCFQVTTSGQLATGVGQKFSGVNDNGKFFSVTLINKGIPVQDGIPGVFYGLFSSEPEGKVEPRWSVPWVIIDEVIWESDSAGWSSESGQSDTEPFRFELNHPFEYDRGRIDFSWVADCSGTTPQVVSFQLGNKSVDLSQGTLFVLKMNDSGQVIFTQRQWKGEFPRESLSGPGREAPPVDQLCQSIMEELGY